MDNTESVLMAGAAKVDITPGPGVILAGAVACQYPVSSVLDPLFARALVLKSNANKLCIISLDVTFIDRVHTGRIRDAAREFGIDPDAVIVHATQTHSAPPIGNFLLDDDFHLPPQFDWLRLGDPAYSDWATEKVIEAVRRANAELRPAEIASGSAVRDGLAFNRRGVMRNGRVGMPFCYSDAEKPLGTVQYRYLEGPDDPEIGVICVREPNGKIISCLLHFTCHPVNEFYHRMKGGPSRVSADWPGVWAEAVEKAYPGCVPVAFNGCCGNINPWPAFQPDFVPDHKRMGGTLAELSGRVISSLSFKADGALDFQLERLPIPARAPDPEKLKAASDLLREKPEPVVVRESPLTVDMKWFQAAMLKSFELARNRNPDLPYEIQAFRIGDTALVGLPGEPFVEGQLKIKMASPANSTFVAHACSHFAGYVPTKDAFARAGHEVVLSSWSFLVPDALDNIVECSSAMVNRIF